jgi:hypothetical protein
MTRVQDSKPQLFERPTQGPFAPGAWASWALAISLTVIAFPHMLVRVFAAADADALKNACRYYPVAMVLLWIPAVLFGIWGALEHPGLEGRASDAVFPLLVLDHLGPMLQGVALAGILAAVMSTLDAQMLTLSSMLTRDVLPPSIAERHPVRLARLFLIVLAGMTFWIVIRQPASIFTLASASFSGYVTVVPTLLLGLHWRRFTVWGATGGCSAAHQPSSSRWASACSLAYWSGSTSAWSGAQARTAISSRPARWTTVAAHRRTSSDAGDPSMPTTTRSMTAVLSLCSLCTKSLPCCSTCPDGLPGGRAGGPFVCRDAARRTIVFPGPGALVEPHAQGAPGRLVDQLRGRFSTHPPIEDRIARLAEFDRSLAR